MGWFVLKNRMLQGPFSEDQLLDACLKGRYTRGDYVISTENAEKGILKYLRLNEVKRADTDTLLLPPVAPGSTQLTAATAAPTVKNPATAPVAPRPLESVGAADRRQGPGGEVTRMFAAALEAADLVAPAAKEAPRGPERDDNMMALGNRVVTQENSIAASAGGLLAKGSHFFLEPSRIFLAVSLAALYVFFTYFPQGVAWRQALAQRLGLAPAVHMVGRPEKKSSVSSAASRATAPAPSSTLPHSPRMPTPAIPRQQEYIPPPPSPVPEEAPPAPREEPVAPPPPDPNPIYQRPPGLENANPVPMIDPETGQPLPPPWPAQPQFEGAPQAEPSY